MEEGRTRAGEDVDFIESLIREIIEKEADEDARERELKEAAERRCTYAGSILTSNLTNEVYFLCKARVLAGNCPHREKASIYGFDSCKNGGLKPEVQEGIFS